MVRTGFPTLSASLTALAVGGGCGELATGAGALGTEAVLGAGVVDGTEGPGGLGKDVGSPGVTPPRPPN